MLPEQLAPKVTSQAVAVRPSTWRLIGADTVVSLLPAIHASIASGVSGRSRVPDPALHRSMPIRMSSWTVTAHKGLTRTRHVLPSGQASPVGVPSPAGKAGSTNDIGWLKPGTV